MDTIKAGRPLREFISLCYAADRPALICGQHGVGKSEMLEQAASDLGIGFICRDLSLMEPTDLTGMPKTSGQNTVFLPPSFLPTSGKGLLVFEELNRCERYMRAPCLQLLTARKLNDYSLPSDWLPLAAINPPDENYEVSELDPALLSRFAQVRIVPDRAEWLNWARRQGVHSEVIKYVESDDSVFDQPESNPRAWKYVSDVLIAAEKAAQSESTLRTVVLGQVGEKRGTAFLKMLKQGLRPLTPAEILEGYKQQQKRMRSWITAGHIELAESSLRAIEVHLQPKAEFQAVLDDAQAWKNLAAFLGDLPADLQEEAEKYFDKRKYKYPTLKTRKARS